MPNRLRAANFNLVVARLPAFVRAPVRSLIHAQYDQHFLETRCVLSTLLPTTYCLLLTVCCLLLTVYCLLLTVYCLLLTVYCVLLTIDCLLLTAEC